MKRGILTFSNKLSKGLTRPKKKFTADMTYGILASNSCLLSDIADTLHEDIKKKNTIERLSLNLAKGTPDLLLSNYLNYTKDLIPDEPVIHIDDTDVVKPHGYKFGSLGRVRDGSASSSSKISMRKDTRLQKIVPRNGHPVSIFSQLYSPKEKNFKSINTITFSAMERGVELFDKATFVMDRGYDDNKMFLKLDQLHQDYVIQITKRRNLILRNKWVSATEPCNRRKGKIKASFFIKAKTIWLIFHM